jgi:cation transport ATPase-like protein
VVSTSLAAGSRQLAWRKVLVKRLVCIEDLGDIEVLFTDKTGTLTEGSLHFMRSADPDSRPDDEPLLLGLLCNEAVAEDGHAAGGNPLDVALWNSPAAARQKAALARYRRLATLPFDHDRRAVSVLVEDDTGSQAIITKGRPRECSNGAPTCPRRPGPAWTPSSRPGTGWLPSPAAPPQASRRSPGPMSRACGSAACWCSSTRPRPPRAGRWTGW